MRKIHEEPRCYHNFVSTTSIRSLCSFAKKWFSILKNDPRQQIALVAAVGAQPLIYLSCVCLFSVLLSRPSSESISALVSWYCVFSVAQILSVKFFSWVIILNIFTVLWTFKGLCIFYLFSSQAAHRQFRVCPGGRAPPSPQNSC